MAKQASEAREKRIHWSDVEWFDLMRLAVPERDLTGKSLAGILWNVQQKVLPKVRHRGLASLGHSGLPVARDFEARFRAGWIPNGRLGEPEQSALERKPEGTQKDRDAALEASFTAKARIVWTEREWTMMSVAVKHRIESGDARSIGRIFFETQPSVLPLDRCRKMFCLSALAPLQKQFDAGIAREWTLPKDLHAKLTGRGAEYEAHLARTAAGLEAANRPIAEPQPVSAPEPEPIPAPAASDTPAPMMFPAAADGDPLAAHIAMILSTAASQISQATRVHVMAEYDRQLDRLTLALASTLRQYVHGLVSAELGGPLSTPPTAAPAAPEPSPGSAGDDLPGEAKIAAPLRVDIIAKGQSLPRDVRLRAEALGIDAQFVHVTNANAKAFKPPHYVIVATDGLPHSAIERIRESAKGLEIARGGHPTIIRTLEALAQHRGALQ